MNSKSTSTTEYKKIIGLFKVYFINILIKNIVQEINEYAKRKISEKQLSKNSIWYSWVDGTWKIYNLCWCNLNMETVPFAFSQILSNFLDITSIHQSFSRQKFENLYLKGRQFSTIYQHKFCRTYLVKVFVYMNL